MRFHVLDGWRGICAVLVALYHLPALGHFFPIPFIRHSWLFVDYFFVLSGFVISYGYVGKIYDSSRYGAFMLRRFGRLWPLHFTMLAVFVAFEIVKLAAYLVLDAPLDTMPFTGPSAWQSIFTNVFLLHSLDLDQGLTWNHPSWSISAEFLIYILFGTLCLARQGRLGIADALLAIVASGGFLVAVSHRYLESTYDFGFVRCVYDFFFGYLIYRLRTAWTESAAPTKQAATILETTVLGLIVAFVSFTDGGRLTMLAPLVFGCSIFVFSFERGALSALLRSKASVFLGERSYSIYMVHAALLFILGKSAKVCQKVVHGSCLVEGVFNGQSKELISLGGRFPMDVLAIVYLSLVVALAALTYKLIEQPGQDFFRRLAAKSVAPSRAG